LVAVLGHGAGEGLVELHYPRLDDLREADEERQADAALPHLVDELFQVDGGGAGAAGMDGDMAPPVNREVAVPPAADVVEVHRVRGGPTGCQRGHPHLCGELPPACTSGGESKRYGGSRDSASEPRSTLA